MRPMLEAEIACLCTARCGDQRPAQPRQLWQATMLHWQLGLRDALAGGQSARQGAEEPETLTDLDPALCASRGWQ